MTIVFFGTPDFAAASLERLLEDGHRVAAVFTQPDKPVGRGYRLTPPPVKALALERGLNVYQPVKLRDGAVAAQVRALAPDLAVVVAYGRILPRDLLEAPRLGCVNLHASLLPKYRGAAPIQWSLLRGETVTGVTAMQMDEGLDTGGILLQLETPVDPDETAPELTDRLRGLGAQCLSQALSRLERGDLLPRPQDEAASTLAPILTKEMGLVDFGRPAREIHNQIRGLAGWPVAYTTLEGKLLKIRRSRLAEGSGPAGTLLDPKKLIVACGEGAVELCEVQLQGKQPLAGDVFLRGARLRSGGRLGE